jgi:asparagine synthase (glutamine-hydrolysing)
MLKYGGSYAGAYLLRRGLFMPWELELVMGAENARRGLLRLKPLRYIEAALNPPPKTSFAKVAALESSVYMRNQLLRDADWASMAHSLEVRVPLVDVRLLQALARYPGRAKNKRLLANTPRLPLPAKVIERSKTGFSTPIHRWLQHDESLKQWRQVPALTAKKCHWSRRWAFQVAAAHAQ